MSRILLVDDDDVDRMAVRRALRSAEPPQVMDEVASAAAAMARLRADPHAYDAIILDYLLPDGDGLALLRDVRAAGVTAPVLVLTGRGDERIAVELMKAGASDYIPKALATTDRLAQSLRAALRLRDAERQVALAQDALRRQLDLTSAIMGSLAEGLVATDAEGRITFVNPAAASMLGVGPGGSLVGRDHHDALHRCGADACALRASLSAPAGTRIDRDFFARLDGSTFPVTYASSPIVTNGRATGAVIAFHDISARLRAEAELERARREVMVNEKLSALGTLVGGVAHEVRTPLTYISTNLHLMLGRVEGAARELPALEPVAREVAAHASAALDGVERINALVGELRSFTRGAIAPRRSLVPLHEVVANAVQLFRSTHRGRVDVEATLGITPLVRADGGQIQRAVINLLTNAAEATLATGGRVRIATRAVAGGAEVSVEDSGPGIPPDVASRIFDPFFTTKQEGTGLGLAITRRIVEVHGGSIAYDTRPGLGTTFRLVFPAASEPADEAASEIEAAAN